MKNDKVIPTKLRDENFRFVLVDGKIPMGKAWNQSENAFRYDHEKLKAWINRKNYGVLHGCGGLIALDADNFPRWQELGLDQIFEDTFTVQTGRIDSNGNRTGRHF